MLEGSPEKSTLIRHAIKLSWTRARFAMTVRMGFVLGEMKRHTVIIYRWILGTNTGRLRPLG